MIEKTSLDRKEVIKMSDHCGYCGSHLCNHGACPRCNPCQHCDGGHWSQANDCPRCNGGER